MRLREAQSAKADYNIKAARLREIVAGVPRGKHTATDVEEARVNYLLLNMELKTGAIIENYARSRIRVQGDPRSQVVELWLNYQLKAESYYDMHQALKDRYIMGLGVIGVGVQPETDKLVWYRIDPLHYWWDFNSGVFAPRWVARQFRARTGESYIEYWDSDTHIIFDGDLQPRLLEPNPIGMIPYIHLVGFSVPGIHYPVGDAELTYPQQVLLQETRRAILDHARRGAGMMLVDETKVPEEELYKLEEPGEPYIRVRDLNAIQPVPTPPINPEWLQIETIAKSDLDAQSGISEYLRGNMPIANNLQFATQVLAALGAQNLRIRIDWAPVKDMLARLARASIRWAHYNRYTAELGDILLSLGEVDPTGLQVSVDDDAANLVAEAGLAQAPDPRR